MNYRAEFISKFFLCSLALVCLTFVGCDGKSSDAKGEKDKQSSQQDKEKKTVLDISPTGPYPKVVVEGGKIHEFGVMEFGTEDTYSFVIHNEGEAELQLKEGTTTCQCTMSKLSRTSVPPGETAEVAITWKPNSVTKMFSKGGTIFTNDPEDPSFFLTVQGKVVDQYAVSPVSKWDMGTLSPESSTEYTGMVYTALSKDLKVKATDVDDPNISVELVPMPAEKLEELEAQSGFFVKLTAKPVQGEVGLRTSTMKLNVEVEGKSSVHPIEVNGSCTGPMQFLPTYGVIWDERNMYLNFGRFPAKDGATARLSLFVNSLDQPLQIADIKTNPPFVKVELKADPEFAELPRKRYDLIFTVPPGSPPTTRLRADEAKITFSTNHPQAKRIQIHVGMISF